MFIWQSRELLIRVLAKKGCGLVLSKSGRLVDKGLITANGKRKYNTSFTDLGRKGYIRNKMIWIHHCGKGLLEIG